MTVSAIEERRRKARDAGWDATCGWDAESVTAALDACSQAATQVRITDEMVEAFDIERNGSTDAGNIPAGLRAAFEAAGFEVIE